jgi:hypothetical protein
MVSNTKNEFEALNKIVIEPCGNEWRLWIPPSKPEHRDESGSDIGPYGVTYFSTLKDALTFLTSVSQELIENGWTPEFLPPN